VFVSDSFPSWLLVTQELKLLPRLVVVSSNRYLDVLQSLLPATCIISVGDIDDFSCPGEPGMIGFIDGGFTSKLGHWFDSIQINRIFTTRQQRRSVSGWDNTSATMSHAALGGVTIATIRIRGAFRTAAPRPLLPPIIAPRDASTVLGVKGSAHTFRRAPVQRHLADGCCENLGSASHPLYHGGGWLPARLDRQTRVLTPHIFASKGSWANRCLGWEEALVCYDAPDSFVTALAMHHVQLDRAFFLGLVPGKCLTSGFTSLNGGVLFFSGGAGLGIMIPSKNPPPRG
jgi:hypothetical protein